MARRPPASCALLAQTTREQPRLTATQDASAGTAVELLYFYFQDDKLPLL